MFPLAHVGIGTHLVPRSVRDELPWRWLALGCLLPDLIDKPIWLVAQWLGANLSTLDTARLLGHTAWFAAASANVQPFLRPPSRCWQGSRERDNSPLSRMRFRPTWRSTS